MRNIAPQLDRVMLRTFEEVQVSRALNGGTLQYDRVAHMWHDDGAFGDARTLPIDGTIADTPTKEEYISVPTQVRHALFTAASIITTGRMMNCHKFSRLAVNDTATGYVEYEPLHTDVSDLSQVSRLALGSVGFVGVNDYGVPHSIVGLGEDNPRALQVMSSDGELGIADIDTMLEFYTNLFGGQAVHLYRATA